MATAICGLFWLREYAARKSVSRENQALAAEGAELRDAAAVSWKAAEEARAKAERAGERQTTIADLEQRNQALTADLKLKELQAIRQKELDVSRASARERDEERERARDAGSARDEEVRSLLGEISELKEAVAGNRSQFEKSRGSFEKDLSEIKERRARLREKVGKLAADREKKAR